MAVLNANDPWKLCPSHMLEGFREYVNKKVMPSGFALALLENNLVEALITADRINYANLNNYVMFLKSAIPKQAWGSRDIVQKWCNSPKQVVVDEAPAPVVKAANEILAKVEEVKPKRPRGRPKKDATNTEGQI